MTFRADYKDSEAPQPESFWEALGTFILMLIFLGFCYAIGVMLT